MVENNDENNDEIECCICTETITFRGAIDSCRHAFCIDCISRWSQIESRCPVCRTRFKFLNNQAVPERDQRGLVEDPAFVDWLESVRCVVCAGADNEDRLLLCDGCDQASHTYCVGLTSVPDDAWYCQQCSLLVDTDSPAIVEWRGWGSGRRRLDLIGSDTTETGIDAENIVDSQESNVDEVPETSVPRGGRRRPRMLVLDDDTDDSEVEVVDLTSPDRLVYGTDTISPPVLDLRSRLRSQLLGSGSGGGLRSPASAMRSPASMSLGATTVSDLNFVRRVATGQPATTPTPRRGGGTFAQHAQVVSRERFSRLPEVIDLRGNRPEGNMGASNMTIAERALRTVRARMADKFSGIAMPSEMLAAVETSATELLVADAARWSVDVGDAECARLADDAVEEVLRQHT